MPVINLNSGSQAAYKIVMCIGWETFFSLEHFSFRGLLLCKHIYAAHMDSDNSISAPGGSTCAAAWDSGPSGQQCNGFGNKSSRVLDEAA